MIRSHYAVARLLVIPYLALLALYIVMMGLGGAVLHYQVRAVETRLLIDEMLAATEPLAERLRSGDAIAAMRDNAAWLVADVEELFAALPALRAVSVQGSQSGYRMESNGAGAISSRAVSPLPVDAQRSSRFGAPDERLHEEQTAMFLVRFDINRADSPLVRLDFAFDRAQLLSRVNAGRVSIERSAALFGVLGAVSLLAALGITAVAMRTTRRLESYFQEVYQRASLTETATQLVHELRNPLAALRANVKALLVSPRQTPEIVEELDRDIVALNDKLRGFLNLTRQRNERFQRVDVAQLIEDAVRLAQPELSRRCLGVETDVAAGLPQPLWQEASLRDALLNLLLNAAQSGQCDGTIRVSAHCRDGCVEIIVEDRGRGFSRQQMPHLFEAFYTTREDGNGLGLAIVQRIVLNHQGRVRAENRAGGGARIVLTLPLQRKESPRWWKRLKKIYPA